MNLVTKRCLMAAGWSLGRHVDTTKINEELIAQSWSPFESALSFLSSYDGLPEFSHELFSQHGFSRESDRFTFNYRTGIDCRDWADALNNRIGVKVIPIGHRDLFEMFIGTDNCIYYINADLLCVKSGYGLEESLDNLFTGAYIEVMDLND